MAFDWSKLIGPAIGAGAAIGGSILSGKAANKQSERQWELIQQEMARRNMLQGMIAPQLLRATGIRNPQQLRSYSQAIGGSVPQIGQQPAGMVPSTPSSTASKVMGGVGTGIGAAGALGLGALGGPPGLIGGAALTLGSKLVGKIGQGRRTADTLTDPETGAEGILNNVLKNPNASLQELQQAYAAYQQAISAYRSAGGNQRKVADQSMSNMPLQETIRRRLAELGG